jgi:hypothetical protein
MGNFKNYINRLNWIGFFGVFLMCGIGAFGRTEDPTLFDSLMVWLILGLPISLIFLFVGMEPKEK